MNHYLSRFAFVVLMISFTNSTASFAASHIGLYRNVGIVGAGIFSAFDALNRILLFSELDKQRSACLDDTCLTVTRTQEVQNAVGLGFAVAPMIGTVATIAVYGLSGSDERAVRRVTFVASSLCLIGSSVELGTAANGLALSVDLASRINSTSRPPDSGRFIATTMLSSASEIASLAAMIAAIQVLLAALT